MNYFSFTLFYFIKKYPWQKSLLRVFTILLPFFFNTINAQFSFDELNQKMQQKPKYIIMNISSQKCIYCMMQQKRIQKDAELQKRLDSQVYYFSWTVEEIGAITFNTYSFKDGNDFVENFGKSADGIIGFPLWIVFDENYNVVFRNPGVLKNENIQAILNLIKK